MTMITPNENFYMLDAISVSQPTVSQHKRDVAKLHITSLEENARGTQWVDFHEIWGICKQVRQQACKTHTPPYSLKQRRRLQFLMPTDHRNHR